MGVRAAAVVLAMIACCGSGFAQTPPTPAAPGSARVVVPGGAPRAMAAVTTDQSVALPSGTLDFTATVEFIRLLDNKDAPEADINTTAYLLKGGDPATRPVTFVINGGPGSSSAWLQLGAVGPWRIDLVARPSASAALLPNRDTWLDATDLVFIDPVGTGYSRFLNTSDEVRKRLWSVDGDIDSLSQAIRRWLDGHGRVGSPKYLLGESYGGFRAPRLARRLADRDGVGLSGLVMISPVLDLGNRSGALDVLSYAAVLPSMQAAVREGRQQSVTRGDLREAEEYASGPFIADALRGPGDAAALDRMVDRVSALTGLEPSLVRQRRGLVGSFIFSREHDRATHGIDSFYDTTIVSADPFPENLYGAVPDPVTDGMAVPLTEGMLSVFERLHWHPDGGLYRVTNGDAFRQWQFGTALYRAQAVGALRQAVALDAGLRVVIAHGVFDLVCPYVGSQWLINQIAPGAGADRVKLVTYPGGHMFYTRDASRAALHAEAVMLLTSAP